MQKKFGTLLAMFFLFYNMVLAQSDASKLKGQVTDPDDSDYPVPQARVEIFLNGVSKGQTQTNNEGHYEFYPIQPGSYELVVSYAGKTIKVPSIQVPPGKTVDRHIKLVTTTETEVVEIEANRLIEVDQRSTGGTFSKAEIDKMPTRTIGGIVALTGGVYSADDQAGFSIRSSRSEGQEYFVDGVRVTGSAGIPRSAIAQMTVITGGTPAEYGDANGGIIQITTAAPSSKHEGGFELVSSQLFDKYGYNLAAINASGPLLRTKDSTGRVTGSKLGYFIGIEFEGQRDPSPSAVGLNVMKKGLLEQYEQTPLQISSDGTYFVNRLNFVTKNDVENTQKKTNAGDYRIRGNFRLDYTLGKSSLLKFGAQYADARRTGWSLTNSLFTPTSNGFTKDATTRAYLKFQQAFTGDSGSKISNIFYTIQADYQQFTQNRSHQNYGDDLFSYGHIGKFENKQAEFFQPVRPGDPLHNPAFSSGAYLATFGYTDTLYTFAPGEANPILSNYNNVIYDYLRNNPRSFFNPFTGDQILSSNVASLNDLVSLGGLRNGDNPSGIYSLYNAPGQIYSLNSKFKEEQFRLTGQANLEVGPHNLKFGFEFQQRVERYWGISPAGLWPIMRQLANKHLTTLDYNNPKPIYVNGVFQDTVKYDRFYDASNQSNFDINLRTKLGEAVNSTKFINTDAQDPSFYSLDMFNASELLNNGSSIVTYYGYDYLGKASKRKNASEFFTNLNQRNQNAYAPTYMSAYLSDNFEIDKMLFSVGVRIDRFDANQKVLKDKYVMRDFYKAGEANKLLGSELNSNVKEDWVPYVDNVTNPSAILGYRDGDKWYDANGAPTDPKLLAPSGKIQPYIKSDSLTIDAFTDFKPQINVMPRISFSFPISDEAVFFAHYDVLTQRPKVAQIGQFTEYLFIQQNATEQINNPDLKSETTIDYEVGFIQGVGPNIKMTLSAYYREMRNMIQTIRNNYAYPITYDSFSNLDFATVKGFTADFETRRLGPLKMRAAYTLSFASGTGSSFNSSRAAISNTQGFAVLRTLLPLTIDQRHTITGNFDFRFTGDMNPKTKKFLNGPGFGGKNDSTGSKKFYPFKGFGANLTYNLGSGTPYSRSSIPNTADVQFGVNSTTQVQGTALGSRLPFNFRMDLRIDRDFYFGGKEKDLGEGKTKKTREFSMNVYVLILNVLNTKNVLGVYQYSGLPTDNGYLNTGVGQQTISSQINPDSFVDLYNLRMISPSNYSLPRRFRLGVSFNF